MPLHTLDRRLHLVQGSDIVYLITLDALSIIETTWGIWCVVAAVVCLAHFEVLARY